MHLDDSVARRAYEMMVVALATEAVTGFRAAVRELVDDPARREQGKRAVDRGEAHRAPALAQAPPELLGRGVALLSGELGEHLQASPRRPHVAAGEQARELFLLQNGTHDLYCTGVKVRITFILAMIAIVAVTLLALYVPVGGTRERGGARRVVAAFYPLAFAAREIGGTSVAVRNLTPAGAEPHDLELAPGEVRAIHDADLVLLLGHGFQPQVEAAARTSGAKVLTLLDTPGLGRHGKDPHVWLDPRRYALLVGQIAGALQRNDRPLLAQLVALDREYRRGLAHCRRRDIVTSHAAFGYLAARYGLRQIAIEGLTPDAEPTPARLRAVAALVRRYHATTIYFETLVSPKIAEAVARETGARTAVLDPIEGLTGRAIRRGADYFTVMRANLAALQEGLGCRRQSS